MSRRLLRACADNDGMLGLCVCRRACGRAGTGTTSRRSIGQWPGRPGSPRAMGRGARHSTGRRTVLKSASTSGHGGAAWHGAAKRGAARLQFGMPKMWPPRAHALIAPARRRRYIGRNPDEPFIGWGEGVAPCDDSEPVDPKTGLADVNAKSGRVRLRHS